MPFKSNTHLLLFRFSCISSYSLCLRLQAYGAPNMGVEAKLALFSTIAADSSKSPAVRLLDVLVDLVVPRLLSRDPMPWIYALLCIGVDDAAALKENSCPRTAAQLRVVAARWADIAATFRDHLLLAQELPPWPMNASIYPATMALLMLATRKASLAVRVLDEYSRTSSSFVDEATVFASRRLAGLAVCTFSADSSKRRAAHLSPQLELPTLHTQVSLGAVQLAAMWATVLPGARALAKPAAPGSAEVAQSAWLLCVYFCLYE